MLNRSYSGLGPEPDLELDQRLRLVAAAICRSLDGSRLLYFWNCARRFSAGSHATTRVHQSFWRCGSLATRGACAATGHVETADHGRLPGPGVFASSSCGGSGIPATQMEASVSVRRLLSGAGTGFLPRR